MISILCYKINAKDDKAAKIVIKIKKPYLTSLYKCGMMFKRGKK